MSQLPSIYIIQASDALQHSRKLRKILQNMQTEKRIRSFSTVGVDSLNTIKNTVKEDDLILILLTNQMGERKEQIENSTGDLRAKHPGIRIGEIIVDNVPYENKFITFPADLRPIRGHEDMDTVWRGIEQSLKELFPVMNATEANPAIDWGKYLKIAGIVIGAIIVLLLIWLLVNTGGGGSGRGY